MTHEVINADVIDWANEYDGPPFMALLCDAPYEMNFMGRDWDNSGIAFNPDTWRALAQHLYPGAFLFVFAGTINDDLISVAMRKAGLRKFHKCLNWAYGSGFPKATRIDTQVDKAAGAERLDKLNGGHIGISQYGGDGRNQNELENTVPHIIGKGNLTAGTPQTPLAQQWAGHRYGLQAIKPAVEVVLVFQKPYEGKPVDSITETGAGALNIEQARVSGEGHPGVHKYEGDCFSPAAKGKTKGKLSAKTPRSGRWPANLTLTHHPECVQVGTRRVRSGKAVRHNIGVSGKGWAHNGFSDTKDDVTYADPDGLETIPAWDCHELCAVRALGEQSGESGASQGMKPSWSLGKDKGDTHEGWRRPAHDNYIETLKGYDDNGSRARYFYNADWTYEQLEQSAPVFYCAKASRRERDLGLDSSQPVEYNKANSTGDEQWESQDQSQSTPAVEDIQQKLDTTDLQSGILKQSRPETSSPTTGSGSKLTDQSPRDSASTISTGTDRTTGSKTSDLSISQRTSESTEGVNCEMDSGGNRVQSVENSSPSQKNIGISQKRGGRPMDDADPATLPESSKISGREKSAVKRGHNCYGDFKGTPEHATNQTSTLRLNTHPCCKPIALTKWLATLLLPPDAYAPRRLLIPFAGSGSEMIGAHLAGWEHIVGVELVAEYAEIAEARLAWWERAAAGTMFNDVKAILRMAKNGRSA